MLDSGEWGLPVLFDGQIDLQKPPGYYWLAAVAGWASGGQVSPFIARLPSALSGLLAVLLVYFALRRDGRPRAALVAAIVLATANHFVAIARTARIDVPLMCAVAGSLVAFYRGYVSVSALAAGFAVLLKGPVGLALIGSTALAFLLVERFTCAAPERFRLPIRSALLGTLIVAGVSLPWVVWANHATGGEFVRVFFWHHNVGRFAGTEESLASHPWWYYGPRLALALLPWTLFLPLLVWGMRSGVWKSDQLFRFGVVWMCVMVAVLSLSKFKRADYLLPAFPGAAIALGCASERWLSSRTNPRSVKHAKRAFGFSLVCALAIWPVMWIIVEPAEAARQEKRPFAEAIRSAAPKPQTILLFRAESHLLAYHLGPPIHTLVEWGELKDRLTAPGPHIVVMPPVYVADAERITGRKLVLVASLADCMSVPPPRPLVCLRTTD